MPTVLKTILTILFVLDSVALIVLVLMQQGKEQGLGTLAGGNVADSFWSKNKGRSKEGTLKKLTRILAVVFFALALILNIQAA